MKTTRIVALLSALLVVVSGAGSSAATVAEPLKSDNIRLVKNDPFGPAGDIAYDGRYVYALERGAKGGLHIYHPRSLKKLAFLKCPTYSDVKPIEKGMIVLDSVGNCLGAPAGVTILDTRNLNKIRVLGSTPIGQHTFRNYPGTRFVYMSMNGALGGPRRGAEPIIDFSDPAKPKTHEFVSSGLGCHDVWIHSEKKKDIAACAAGSETQIWDVSDPAAPVTLSRIPTPQTFFNHSAAISDDGNLLIVGDEAHGATECVGGPSGDIWAYDISDPKLPVLKSDFSLNRGTPVSSFWVDPENEWCSAHNYEFIPGTHTLVAGWYAGGMNVIDFSDAAAPKEIAHYMADETSVWGAYWIEGRIWTSDDDRGVDVFEVKGL
jgi:hypothetical protein